MTSLRKRGRPLGAGIDDDADLSKIALLIVTGQAADFAAAAATVLKTHKAKGSPEHKSIMARWRGKWKKTGQMFLDQANTPIDRQVHGPVRLFVGDAQRLIAESLHEQHMTALQNAGMTWEECVVKSAEAAKIMRDPMVRTMLDHINSGAVQAAVAAFRKYQS